MGKQSLAAAAGDQIPTDSGGKVDSPNCKSEIRICHQRDLRKRLRERKRDLDLRESIYFVEFFFFVSGSILFLPLTMNAPFLFFVFVNGN